MLALFGKRQKKQQMNVEQSRSVFWQNKTPPDLDQVLRDFNRRLSALFGQGGGGGNSNAPADLKRWLLIGGTVFLGLWASSGFFQISEGQKAVILQFGKPVADVGAGFHWRFPTPFQSHEVVNVGVIRKVEVGFDGALTKKNEREALMLTQDGNIVDVQMVVQFNVVDARKYLFNNRTLDYVRDPDAATSEIVKQIAESALRENVGKHSMNYVLYDNRTQLGVDVQQTMQQQLDRYDSGVRLSSVLIQNAQAPEKVQAAFQDVLKARQDFDSKKQEGQAYYNKHVPIAESEAQSIVINAQGYQQKIISNAKGDVSRFDQIATEYAKAPKVTRERLYIDAMRDVYSVTPKVFVDSKNGNHIINLNTDRATDRVNQAMRMADELQKQNQTTANSTGNTNAASIGINNPEDSLDARLKSGNNSSNNKGAR